MGSGKTLLRTACLAALASLATGAPAFGAGAAPASRTAATPAPTTSTTAPGLSGAALGQLSSLAQRDEGVTVDELNLLTQMQATKTTLATVTAKETAIDGQVQGLQTQLTAEQQRLDQDDQQIQTAQATLTAVEADLVSARDDVRREAIAAYVGGPDTSAGLGSSLADPASTASALDRLSYLASLENTQQESVDRLQSLTRQSASLERGLSGDETVARAQRDSLQGQVTQLDAARQQQDTLRQAAVAAGQQQAVLLAQLQAQKSTVDAQIAALASSSATITSQLHTLQAGENISTATIDAAKGMFGIPIPGAPITSGFGPRVDPFYGDVRVHTGIDFGASTGTPIHASAGGIVVVAGVVNGYGNCTIIDDGSGFGTLYGHQSVLLVKAGQHVVAGQIIGLVGSTGFSTGPHLHFEIRVNGTPVDPMPFLAFPAK